MIPLADALPLLTGPAAPFVKSTLVLLAGAVTSVVLRRQPAATRHYVWLLTLAGTLVVALPAPRPWQVEVPVATVTAPGALTTIGPDVPTGTLSSAGARVDRAAASVSASASTPRTTWPRPSLGLLWLLGAGLVLGWHLLGHWGVARLARAAAPVRDRTWQALVPDTVAVRTSPAVGSPLVYGVVRPTILLPVEASKWNDERRRVVVLHELAHVARGDALSQLLAMVACSLWWFHPGVWLAARRLRAESERACDDRVMAAGVTALDYAAHLLEVARNARALRLAGAVAITMARRSTLEGRLLAMLDGRRRTGALTRSARMLGAVCLTLVLAAITVVRPVARPVSAQGVEEVAAAPAATPTVSAAQNLARLATPAPSPVAAELIAANHSKKDDSQYSEEEGSPFRDVANAKPGETLVLELETGGSVIVRGWSQNQVQVNGVLAGKDWDHTQTDLRREGDRVIFSSMQEDPDAHNFTTSHRFDIRVPHRFNVKIRSAGGKITLIDLEGSMTGHSGGGGITMERLKGHASLTTGGGEIHVDDVNMSGRVSTGGGLVKLSRVSGGLRGTSGSGPVIERESDDPDVDSGNLDDVEVDASSINIGKTAGGRLHIKRAGGDLDINEAPQGVKATTGGGKVTLGPSAQNVELSTGGGSMEIGRAKGSVSAGTGAGDIHLVLAKSNERDRDVKLWSGNGTIVIELENGVGVDLDLETAYTEGYKRTTHIRSDVPVDIRADDEWDITHGTPRKYLRARAVHGDGSVHVLVRTVNGDIVIKRK